MEAVLLPRSLLDLPGVADLSGAQKYIFSGLCLLADASGIVALTDFKCAGLGFLPSVALQLIHELASRGILVYDGDTKEVFINLWFHWQKTGTDKDKWGKQRVSALLRARSAGIVAAVNKAIETAPAEKIASVLVPGNILTSLRHPAPGRKWEATPQLLLLSLYLWPSMTWAGVCVVDYDALSSYVSGGGAAQIVGHLRDLDEAGIVVFDYDTGELFLPARLKNARGEWHMKEILDSRAQCVSHRIKTNFSRVYKRTFGKFPSNTTDCAPVELSLLKKSSSKVPPEAAAPGKESWLITATHPKTAAALESLFENALRMNKKGSDEALDTKRCREALEFCQKTNLPDQVAAKAAADSKWPKELRKAMQSALINLNQRQQAERREEGDRRHAELASVSCGDALSLVGKTLVQKNTGAKVLIKNFGATIGGNLKPLPAILEMLNRGDLATLGEKQVA